MPENGSKCHFVPEMARFEGKSGEIRAISGTKWHFQALRLPFRARSGICGSKSGKMLYSSTAPVSPSRNILRVTKLYTMTMAVAMIFTMR